MLGLKALCRCTGEVPEQLGKYFGLATGRLDRGISQLKKSRRLDRREAEQLQYHL
jgi:hypothetical protein